MERYDRTCGDLRARVAARRAKCENTTVIDGKQRAVTKIVDTSQGSGLGHVGQGCACYHADGKDLAATGNR